MKFYLPWKSMLMSIGVIIIMLVVTSLFDILLVFFNPRFYSSALLIVTFGVGGVFAAVFAYMYAIQVSPEKNELARWSIISMLIISGLLFFFLLSKIEGGEYGSAFKAYGITLCLSSLLFRSGKVDV